MRHYVVALFLFLKLTPPTATGTTSGVLIVGFASASAPSSGLSGLKLTVLILASSGRLSMSCSPAAVPHSSAISAEDFYRSFADKVAKIHAATADTDAPTFTRVRTGISL